MDTYSEPRRLVDSPRFEVQKREGLAGLTGEMIDEPIAGIVAGFNQIPCCFTLQSCFGHFLFSGQEDPHDCGSLPDLGPDVEVEYKIAYLAFCLDNNDQGKRLLERFREITQIDPDNIQLCSPDWFWEKQINAYALQVEPDRFKHQDTAVLGFGEALRVEKTRNEFFREMEVLSRTGGV